MSDDSDVTTPGPDAGDPVMRADSRIQAYVMVFYGKDGERGIQCSPGLTTVDSIEMLASADMVLRTNYMIGAQRHAAQTDTPRLVVPRPGSRIS